ncbi:cupin domain-containing protein [Sneathiella sp.]|uniref:cupin domain-containing protein n=1 Tax=Sneathiella sp. TaxID=1964365 RepID=UPI00356A49E8
MTAAEIIARLHLQPHPEGGHFVETFRDSTQLTGTDRAVSTAIYYLLEEGDYSHWHRVDAPEIWHFYAGASLTLSVSPDGKSQSEHILGPELLDGERPQIIIPMGHWQSARSRGAWTLVGCTVAPGFQFDGFEMAAPDWAPGGS